MCVYSVSHELSSELQKVSLLVYLELSTLLQHMSDCHLLWRSVDNKCNKTDNVVQRNSGARVLSTIFAVEKQ